MNTPPPLPTRLRAERKTGLAIASLVLGLLSPACFSVFTGVPAIVTGHMARSRAKKQPEVYGGGGMALTGLIFGYLSILTTALFVALVIVPAVTKTLPFMAGMQQQGAAPPNSCVNHLKQIDLAARIWSNDHNDTFPPDFKTMSVELMSPKILVCPDDKTKTAAVDWAHFDPNKNLSYKFLLPGATESNALDKPVFLCPIHGHVSLGDGRVQEYGKGKAR